MTVAAFNPNDPTQAGFLAALALGETGSGGSSTLYEGVGGSNLAGAPTDAYGFPEWTGQGNSHAAGTFQFEPATWDALAAQFGLNFANPADQAAGAWYNAEQTFTAATGGDLETALKAGDYTQVQQALESQWPSVVGNAAAPQGLALDLASGTGATLPDLGIAGGATGSGFTQASLLTGGGSGIIATIENFFVRFGLIILGGIIVVVALWELLSSQGVVPSPGQAAKAVAAAV